MKAFNNLGEKMVIFFFMCVILHAPVIFLVIISTIAIFFMVDLKHMKFFLCVTFVCVKINWYSFLSSPIFVKKCSEKAPKIAIFTCLLVSLPTVFDSYIVPWGGGGKRYLSHSVHLQLRLSNIRQP